MKKLFYLLILCISTLSFAQTKAPFIGKRSFNILEGFSGSGTPAYYVDVKKNGDVHFGYVQVNQADGTETSEDINVGKYHTGVMKVHFKKFNEKWNFKFNKDKIYFTDDAGKIMKSEDCCSVEETESSSCECEGILYK
jgi:hypothetical protein